MCLKTVWMVGWCLGCVWRLSGGGCRWLEGTYEDVKMYMKDKSGQVKIGQLMSGSIQSDLSFENLASSSLQYEVVSLAQLVSLSVALLAKLVEISFSGTTFIGFTNHYRLYKPL